MTDAVTETAQPNVPPDADPGSAGPRPSTFSVFRKRDFRLLW